MATELQMLAPTLFGGAVKYVPSADPSVWLYLAMPARTSGLSQPDEMPT